METSKSREPRKLWGILKNDLVAGTYNLRVMNNYDPRRFGGKKYLLMTLPITEEQLREKKKGGLFLIIALSLFIISLLLSMYHKVSTYKEPVDDDIDQDLNEPVLGEKESEKKEDDTAPIVASRDLVNIVKIEQVTN